MDIKSFKDMWNRISNTSSLLAIVSALLVITNTLGAQVDNKVVMLVADAILTILVILGIVNKSGMETSKWNE